MSKEISRKNDVLDHSGAHFVIPVDFLYLNTREPFGQRLDILKNPVVVFFNTLNEIKLPSMYNNDIDVRHGFSINAIETVLDEAHTDTSAFKNKSHHSIS